LGQNLSSRAFSFSMGVVSWGFEASIRLGHHVEFFFPLIIALAKFQNTEVFPG
jgi:hypothetical protein